MTLTFRPLRREDFRTLGRWFSMPHVEPWWRESFDDQSIESRYGPVVNGSDPTEIFIVEDDGSALGLVQRYLIADDPEWEHSLSVAPVPTPAAGIDYLIGIENMTGKGLGPLVIGRFVEDSWPRYPDIAAIVVSVSQENRRSWRALEKCGFQRVWSGALESEDPSDEGASYVYTLDRP